MTATLSRCRLRGIPPATCATSSKPFASPPAEEIHHEAFCSHRVHRHCGGIDRRLRACRRGRQAGFLPVARRDCGVQARSESRGCAEQLHRLPFGRLHCDPTQGREVQEGLLASRSHQDDQVVWCPDRGCRRIEDCRLSCRDLLNNCRRGRLPAPGLERGMPAIKPPDPIARALAARVVALLPGIGLSVLITVVSLAIQYLEERVFGHPYLEGLVMAILIGIVVRTFWEPGSRWRPGIAFSAKQLLEAAVVLLGATITFSAIAASGLSLIAAILTTVCIVLGASYSISRLLGLSVRLSILVACGNSICGNSAIAAVAPVIGANGDD